MRWTFSRVVSYDTSMKRVAPSPNEAAAVWVHLDQIKPWDRNPRKNDDTVPKIVRALKRFGWGRTLVVRSNGELIVGHTATKAAHELVREWATMAESQREAAREGAGGERWHPEAIRTATDRLVPVRYRDDLSADEAHKLAVEDNRSAQDSKWDDGLLAELLGEWDSAGDDLTDLGFSEKEIDQLLGDGPDLLEEIDVSATRAEFVLIVQGPLTVQPEVLEQLKGTLEGLGAEVTLTTEGF